MNNGVQRSRSKQFRLRDPLLISVILSVIFLAALSRDMPISVEALSRLRNSVLQSFDSENQYLWWWVLAIDIALLSARNLLLLWQQRFPRPALWNHISPNRALIACACALCIAVVVSFRYWIDYARAASRTDSLVLLNGIIINQLFLYSAIINQKDVLFGLRSFATKGFVVFSCFSFLLSPLNSHHSFFYHGHTRWTGIFPNPNLFGLVMGVSCVLCLSNLVESARFRRKIEIAFYSLLMLWSIICVAKSYSRGAWVAVLIGFLAMLSNGLPRPMRFRMGQGPNVQKAKPLLSKMIFAGFLGVIVGFCCIAAIASGLKSNNSFAKRLLATFSAADFSSRNRIMSYQDGVNMLMDRPLTGYGWEDIIAIHNSLYLHEGLSDGTAIILNDFLIFALRFGVVTLAVLLMLMWISIASRNRNQNLRPRLLECKIAFMMLGTGFLFTDGFFSLTAGGLFWLFMTLSFEINRNDSVGQRSGAISCQ
jgi:hypothetical protein